MKQEGCAKLGLRCKLFSVRQHRPQHATHMPGQAQGQIRVVAGSEPV